MSCKLCAGIPEKTKYDPMGMTTATQKYIRSEWLGLVFTHWILREIGGDLTRLDELHAVAKQVEELVAPVQQEMGICALSSVSDCTRVWVANMKILLHNEREL